MPIERPPLLDQVVVSLLEDLAKGAYPQRLPSERDLAITLNVSRPIVRSALQILEKQGWIQTQDRSKSRKVLNRPPPKSATPAVKTVGILTSRPMDEMSADDFSMVNDVMRKCEKAGWKTVIHPIDQLGPQNLQRRLEEIAGTPSCDLWVGFPMSNFRSLTLLHQMGHKVIGINIMEKGSGYGIIHYDMIAARIHALGVMLRAGKKNIIMPMSRRRPAEVVGRVNKLLAEFGIRYREDQHLPLFDGTREGFLRLLDNHFSAQPRPDGIVLLYTTEVSVILLEGWLMKSRLRFPDDVSVIQLGSDPFLSMMHTPVTHYTTEPKPLAEAAFSAIRRYFTTGELLTGRLKLDIQYVKGESV